MINITIQELIDAYNRNNYKLYTEGDLNLNIFGIRSNIRKANLFDDTIGILYKFNNKWTLFTAEGTTDAGNKSLVSPVNNKGCAILKAGQYIGAFKIGYHKGRYEALIQNKELPVYRDNNYDTVLDFDEKTLENGMFGINIHHASNIGKSSLVENWSAGCQVIADITDWNDFMHIVNLSGGRIFSYTLFNEYEVL